MTIIHIDEKNTAYVSKDGVIINHLVWNFNEQRYIYEKLFIPFDKFEEIRTELTYESE